MKTFVAIYAAIYALAAVATIIDDFRAKHPWWDVSVDVISLPLGLAGLLLYLGLFGNSAVRELWKIATALIVISQTVSTFIIRKRRLHAEVVRGYMRWATDTAVCLLLIPMFLLNALYAFS